MNGAQTPDTAAARHPEDARVTGGAMFTADVRSKDALHAAFALSTAAHARIVSIDVSAAQELPGVVAVLTGGDIGEILFGRSLRDYPVLAVDRVLFVGQRVAVVAALDQDTARLAADLIAVEYEPLDPLLTIDDVLTGPDVQLHPHPESYEGHGPEFPVGNLQGGDSSAEGDVERAFEESEDVYEHSFGWARSHAAPIETHCCLVTAGSPKTYVYSAHKEPYSLRRDLARISGREEDDFVVLPITIGGDFGIKAGPFIEAACYLLSLLTGRPVRMAISYTEELTSTSTRHPGFIRLRSGLRQGRVHAHEAETVLDGGAFAAAKPRPTRTIPFVGLPLRPYRVTNRDERMIALYSNNIPGGHVRAPGEFQAVFAGESHVDMIARARGVDPIEFRLAHVDIPQTERILQLLREHVQDWRAQDRAHSGIGVAVFDRAAGPGFSKVSCKATASEVRLLVAVPDQGSGMYATFRRMVAGRLGIADEAVTVEPTGTGASLPDRGAGASRVTHVVGQACIKASDALLEQLDAKPPGNDQGNYWVGERLARLGKTAIEVTGEARVEARGAPAFGGLALQVVVDPETGTIAPQRAALIVDGGEVLNPVGYRGQLEGGFVYGLSQTLFEELIVEDGQVVTASLGDYKLACAGDVPPLETRLLPPERTDGTDIRAVGEIGNLGVPAAVANAVDDAVGVRIQSLPITAEKVWRALNEV